MQDMTKKWSPKIKWIDAGINSPILYHKKCMESNVKNKHADIGALSKLIYGPQLALSKLRSVANEFSFSNLSTLKVWEVKNNKQ